MSYEHPNGLTCSEVDDILADNEEELRAQIVYTAQITARLEETITNLREMLGSASPMCSDSTEGMLCGELGVIRDVDGDWFCVPHAPNPRQP